MSDKTCEPEMPTALAHHNHNEPTSRPALSIGLVKRSREPSQMRQQIEDGG